MEQTARVIKTNDDGTAQVIHIRESACSGDCHKCSGCGAAKQTMILTAGNPIGAGVGDSVIIHSASGPVLAAAAVLYLLPLALFVAGYIAGESIWRIGPVTGGIAFVLSLILVGLYDRRILKRKNTQYTIIGYDLEPDRREGNHLD